MAGMVTKETIERIRNSLDIVDVVGAYIQVKRAGSTATALCPFHKEKTPSFHVNSARQMFYCFGCGEGGDLFKFVMLYEGVDFPTSIELLAPRAGVPIEYDRERPRPKREGPTKDELFKANEAAAKAYHRELLQSPEAETARAYLRDRTLALEAWQEWGLGYAPESWGFLTDSARQAGEAEVKVLENAGLAVRSEKGTVYDRFRGRLMFPIRDELGRVAGFSGRLLKEAEDRGGKYVNTPETDAFRKSRILFGLDKAKREVQEQRKALLVEGQIDCIRCHLGGFGLAVAAQGTAFTEDHARLLKRYADHVVVVQDADTAGQKAALRTAGLLLDEGLVVSVAMLPPGEDPDSLIARQGAEAFGKVLAEAQTAMGFLVSLLRAKLDLRDPAGLLRATRAVVDLALHADGAVQAEQMLREAAAGLQVGYTALQQDWRRAKRTRQRRAAPAASAGSARAPAVERPVDEVELATLLCGNSHPELAGFVRRWLPYAFLSDPACRAIIEILAEEEEELMPALADEPEDYQALAAKIANAPSKLADAEEKENILRAAQDLTVRIWRRHLEGQRQDISRRMQELTGAERQSALYEMADVLRDLGELKMGWEKARPVLDQYLQRMAEE